MRQWFLFGHNAWAVGDRESLRWANGFGMAQAAKKEEEVAAAKQEVVVAAAAAKKEAAVRSRL
jgi:hypothetical protein